MKFLSKAVLYIEFLAFLTCLIVPFAIDTQPIGIYAQAEVTFETEEACISESTFNEIQDMDGKILTFSKTRNFITVFIPTGKEQTFKTSMKKLKKVKKIETHDSAKAKTIKALKANKYPTPEMKRKNQVELILGFYSISSYDSIQNLILKNGGVIAETDEVLESILLVVPLGKEQDFIKKVIKSQMIRYIEINYPSFSFGPVLFSTPPPFNKDNCPEDWGVEK